MDSPEHSVRAAILLGVSGRVLERLQKSRRLVTQSGSLIQDSREALTRSRASIASCKTGDQRLK
jgi:hypothetical protein